MNPREIPSEGGCIGCAIDRASVSEPIGEARAWIAGFMQGAIAQRIGAERVQEVPGTLCNAHDAYAREVITAFALGNGVTREEIDAVWAELGIQAGT